MSFFNELCEWLEISCDQLYSISELHSIMKGMAQRSGHEEEVYSERHFKDKLIERYMDHLTIATVAGKSNVVCFKDMASLIINDKWYRDRESNIEEESRRIIVAAAKLVRNQLREQVFDTDSYPLDTSFSDIDQASKWLPELLNIFLNNIIGSELKRLSIGHAIVQAARPRSTISPILFAVAITMDHAYGSRWAIDLLSHLGYSLSYDEVTRYKQSALQCDDLSSLPQSFPMSFVQWSADNVDHNINTIDGSNTFHGMGVLSMSTPLSSPLSGHFSETSVLRLKRLSDKDIVKNRGIPLISYSQRENRLLSSIKFEPFDSLKLPTVHKPNLSLDLLWHSGWFCSDDQHPRVNWSGFMQDVTADGCHPPKADIRMLPIIDLNPSDMTCIFSTLSFLENQAAKLNMPVACVTFDQALYIKAFEICRSERLNVVCRLGGFHTIMNFVGSLGKLMEESGLSEALSTCFGSATVNQILMGKNVARAIRGHILVYSALTVILFQQLIAANADVDLLSDVLSLYRHVCAKEQSLHPDTTPDCLRCLNELLTELKDRLGSNCRTAKLWLQLMYYVEVLLDFIRAERTSDWNLHLLSLYRMLSLFAATGHRNYAKSGRLYLEEMLQLQNTQPWLYDMFANMGLHSVRRSDRYLFH